VSQWRQVALLAKREFKERATSKPFLITMSILVLVILAVGPAVNFFVSDETEATRIGLVGNEPAGIEQAIDAQAAVFEIEVELVRYADRAAAETALADGDAAVVLADGTEIVFHTDVSSRLSALVGGAVNTSVKSEALADLGLSDGEVAAVVAPVPVTVVTLEEEDVEEDTKRAAAFIGTLALYISILMFGQFVAMGTVEEKQNRVVEVILSRVRPWQILVGKVVGIGVLGLLQLALLAGAAYFSAQMADLSNVDLASIGLPIIAAVFFWFILGYTFYAFLYAAVGSTVSRQEDLQGAMMMPIVLIVPGYILALVAAENPNGLVPTIGSMLPPWAPFVMPVRIAAGAAETWEILVAVLGTALAAVVLVWLGSRVYAGALLRTGGKVKLLEAWRAAGE
jgi:ABC-2 type transport system permease protein